jgi:hypothetical protein
MAIHVRHIEITQHDVGMIERRGRESFYSIFSLEDTGPILLEIRYQGVAKNCFVLYHQDP